MAIKPMIRNNICLNSHPSGCAAYTRRQIEYAKGNFKPRDGVTPKLALIIGCSGGYGLASRIAAAFGYGALTVGISKEKPPSGNHSATPGFYNNRTFDYEAEKAGLISRTLDGDAFSDEIKAEAVSAIREAAAAAKIPAKADLLVYSIASPVRTEPKSGIQYKSVIKPIGKTFSGKTLDIMSGTFITSNVAAATEEEIFNTVKVMGGEDWELWMEALDKEGLLSQETRSVAYTYIGPESSWAIYKNGTIGKAKEDLERAARNIQKTYGGKIAGAWVSVNKALVTRASSVIPVIPFYVSCLFRVMKEMGLHEGCIEQITRLYRDRLYTGKEISTIPCDSEGRIRLDDWEMRPDVQEAVKLRMNSITPENVMAETDAAGFRHDFLEANGFDVAGIDYET